MTQRDSRHELPGTPLSLARSRQTPAAPAALLHGVPRRHASNLPRTPPRGIAAPHPSRSPSESAAALPFPTNATEPTTSFFLQHRTQNPAMLPPHSYLSATIGSTPAARRAGTQDAAIATVVSSAAAHV